MLFELITLLITITIFYLIYVNLIQNRENFSIVYPFYNEYHPYANPFSECIEDVYGDYRCYDPVDSFRYLPCYYKYPRRYRNIHHTYKKIR